MEVGFWRFTSMTPFFQFFTNRIHAFALFVYHSLVVLVIAFS